MYIAWVWDLQTTSFEIPWFLGWLFFQCENQSRVDHTRAIDDNTPSTESNMNPNWLHSYPKNPEPSYGNTRPSVHDTPKRASKQVATWHPMTFKGFLGQMKVLFWIQETRWTSRGEFLYQKMVSEARISWQILHPKNPQGPSNGGVWTCIIARVRVLKIASFEGSGSLGQNLSSDFEDDDAPKTSQFNRKRSKIPKYSSVAQLRRD